MRTPRSLWITLPLLAVAGMLTAFAPLPAAPTTLTDSEADGLAFMREEEKLAHDLYVAMADQYELRSSPTSPAAKACTWTPC